MPLPITAAVLQNQRQDPPYFSLIALGLLSKREFQEHLLLQHNLFLQQDNESKQANKTPQKMPLCFLFTLSSNLSWKIFYYCSLLPPAHSCSNIVLQLLHHPTHQHQPHDAHRLFFSVYFPRWEQYMEHNS